MLLRNCIRSAINWIGSGIRYVKDLIFVHGVLATSVYYSMSILLKRETHLLSIFRSAQLPHVNSIVLEQNNDTQIMYEPKVSKETSKCYYNNVVNNKLS